MKLGQFYSGVFLALSLFSIAHSKEEDWKEKFPPGFKAEGSLIEGESDRPYYADYFGRRLNETKHPSVARIAADKFYDSVPFEKRSPHRDKIRVDFIRGYFAGFTNPGGSMSGGRLGGAEGFQAGQEYRRRNPEKLTDIMKGFGYTPIEVEGTWATGFEHSGFKPKDAKDDEEWWLRGVGEIDSGLPNDFHVPDSGVLVTIQGYVSPEGRYGHLGSYKYEVFVRKFNLKKAELQALPPGKSR